MDLFSPPENARWSDFAPRASFNFSDVSNIEQRRGSRRFHAGLITAPLGIYR
jgi:hypothetical protein